MQFADMDVTSRTELSDLIRCIKAAIGAGSLRQDKVAHGVSPPLDFSLLEPDGPWPDVIEAEFLDTSGQRFRIEVETYHGAGGRWKRC